MHVRDRPSLKTQRALYGVKQYWLAAAPRRAPHIPCSIIDCFERPAVSMNSMPYCYGHRGLALLHALRHDCRSCHLFSLLALKHTGGDYGHQVRAHPCPRFTICYT